MNLVGYIALLAWPLIAIALAGWLRVPRAAVASCIIAWLFLPEGGMDLPGPIDLSKINVTTLSLLAGLLLVEPRRLAALRPTLADLPITVLCLSPFFSSLGNGLGPYDGLSEAITKTLAWGIPWIVGRAWFTCIADLRALAVGIVLGGLVYLPLCLYEIRMSPQLHRLVYGFFPHDEFAQTRRFGGFRPNVFMQHGLAVGLWMGMAGLAGAWLWQGERLRALLRLPIWIIVPAQVGVAVLCKSSGAIVLMLGGAGVLFWSRLTQTRLILLALALLPSLYIGYRVLGGPTEMVVDIVADVPVLSQRVDSLAYRLEAEQILLDHALQRPVFGWGGYGRHRPLNDDGEQLTRTDSLWIIVLGQNGAVGLIALYLALAAPLWIVARRVPAAALLSPRAAPLLILAVIVTLFACDSLFNAMLNPVYVMAGGGVVATMQAMRVPVRRSASAPRRAVAHAADSAAPARNPGTLPRLRPTTMTAATPGADANPIPFHAVRDRRS